MIILMIDVHTQNVRKDNHKEAPTPYTHASVQITRWNQKLNTLEEDLFIYVDSFKIKHQK